MHDGERARANGLRAEILRLTREYAEVAFPDDGFDPAVSTVPVAGRVFDGDEVEALVDASLDFWLTAGRNAAEFERRFGREVFGRRHTALVNSGSSANLVAISALSSPKLGDRRIRPGDEVITCATGFPTTVNPILQIGAVPVFLDVSLPTYNIDVRHLEDALSPRTRAVVIAHTLGNPFDLGTVAAFCERHGLWLVEDCCDALGARYDGRPVGSFGAFATASFFPAHHITMGEGGAVVCDDGRLKVIAESFRDWGRDCWCDPGCDNTCGKRFGHQLGALPAGYDHKYTYSHVGYNLKVTDMQAAIGVAQLAKLDGFIARRTANFARLRAAVGDLADMFVLPEATPGAEPSWFGFPLTVRPEAGVTRGTVVAALEAARIATRPIFAGNLLRQPAYLDVPHRVVGALTGADTVLEHSFWLGVYPALGDDAIDHVAAVLHEVAAAPRPSRPALAPPWPGAADDPAHAGAQVTTVSTADELDAFLAGDERSDVLVLDGVLAAADDPLVVVRAAGDRSRSAVVIRTPAIALGGLPDQRLWQTGEAGWTPTAAGLEALCTGAGLARAERLAPAELPLPDAGDTVAYDLTVRAWR